MCQKFQQARFSAHSRFVCPPPCCGIPEASGAPGSFFPSSPTSTGKPPDCRQRPPQVLPLPLGCGERPLAASPHFPPQASEIPETRERGRRSDRTARRRVQPHVRTQTWIPADFLCCRTRNRDAGNRPEGLRYRFRCFGLFWIKEPVSPFDSILTSWWFEHIYFTGFTVSVPREPDAQLEISSGLQTPSSGQKSEQLQQVESTFTPITALT